MRSRLRILALLLALAGGLLTRAQALLPLSLTDIRTGSQPDGFGGEQLLVEGEVFNYGDEAYSGVNVYVTALNAADEAIGEGFGYLVDACGSALWDYALPPGRSQLFRAPYELYAAEAMARLDIDIDARPAPAPPPAAADIPDITRISAAEVVMLEWLDDQSLIYGVGCADDVFTELDWHAYSLRDGSSAPTQHPDAHRVTPHMLEIADITLVTQAGEQNPDLYYRSGLTYAPTARRIVYQNDLHSIFTAEPDGSYRRLIHPGLHRHSLRGILWSRNPGVFLAYYYGAYGDPVYYFTANVDGQMLSDWLDDLPPSQTVPGPAPDGYAVVVGRETAGVRGYYWQHIYGASTLLFEAELPGNNYPAPLVTSRGMYIVRDVEGSAALQCFGRESRALSTMTPLPLRLTRDGRAWSWLSPDGRTLALAANGVNSGLWLVDVAAGCF